MSCIDDIIAASGNILSKREAAELLRKFNNLTKKMSDSSRLGTLDAMIREASEKMVASDIMGATLAKSHELRYKMWQDQNSNRIAGLMKKHGKTVRQAIDSLIHGSPEDRQGLIQIFNGAKDRQMVHLIASLQEQGLTDEFKDPHIVKQALEVLFDPKAHVDESAQKIGMILREAQKLAVVRLNESGAYAPNTPGVLLSAYSADSGKVRAMTREQFIDSVVGHVDNSIKFQEVPEGTKNPNGLEAAELAKREHLGKVYDRIKSGEGYAAPAGTFDGLGGMTKERWRNVSKSISPAYDIPFKDAKSYLTYLQDFGGDPINAVLFRQIDRVGRAVGLMEAFSVAPERAMRDLLAKHEHLMSPEDRAFLLKEPTALPKKPVIESPFKKDSPEDKKFREDFKEKEKKAAKEANSEANKEARKEARTLQKRLTEEKAKKLGQSYLRVASKSLMEQVGEDLKSLPPARLFDYIFHDSHPEAVLADLSGITQVPVDPSFARGGQAIRSWATMAALGNGVFKQLCDLPIKMALLSKYAKGGIFETAARPFVDMANGIAQKYGSAESKAYLARIGAGSEILIRNMAHEIGGSGQYQTGAWAKAMEGYFKLNLMGPFDGAQRKGNADFLSKYISEALIAPDKNKSMVETLKSYGFSNDDLLKMSKAVGDFGGHPAINPKLLESIDGKLYEKFLGTMDDWISTITPTPGAKERSIVHKGTRTGTLEGETLRSFMLFKTYPSMFMHRVLPQLYYDTGRGGVAATLLTTMLMWYVGDSLKALSRGQTPRDMSKPENVYQMMIQSGFGGLYSDIMMANYNQYGRDFWSSVGGPVAGQINNAFQLGSGLTHWRQTEDGNWRPELTPKMAISKVRRALPSLHLEQTILDNTIIHAMMEASDPGYQQRMNEQLQERTGQQTLWR